MSVGSGRNRWTKNRLVEAPIPSGLSTIRRFTWDFARLLAARQVEVAHQAIVRALVVPVPLLVHSRTAIAACTVARVISRIEHGCPRAAGRHARADPLSASHRLTSCETWWSTRTSFTTTPTRRGRP